MENEKKQNNSGLKAAVVILALLLLGSVGYIFKMTSDNKKEVTELTSEKDKFANDLRANIEKLKASESENAELDAERQKLIKENEALLAKVEKAEGDAAAMARYKNEYFRLKREQDNLVAEIKLLKEQNIALTSSLDSTNVVLDSERKFKDTLLVQNDNLAKTVEKGSKLSVLNLNVQAVKERSSGKQIDTDKASRADKLKVSFVIAENQIAKSGTRKYYVQVIDSKNNILGDKETIALGGEGMSLTYSFITQVKYENKSVQVNEELSGKDFQSGTYFVNVFNEKGENVSKTSFNLR